MPPSELNNRACARDLCLHAAVKALDMHGIYVDHKIIEPGDELALWPEERRPFIKCVPQVRRASGAARIVGRRLLGDLGYAPCALPRSKSGCVSWPAGVIGSLAHDSRIAAAAVARRGRIIGVGIDVEPTQALPHDIFHIVLTSRERQLVGDDGIKARLFFVLKEATYKALFPIDQQWREHHDVEIDSTLTFARLSVGRTIPLSYCIASHIIGLATISIA